MFYLALQTAALIAATYFIGTFLGCLLHKFFNMLFGSHKRTLATVAGASVVGATAALSADASLYTKDKDGRLIKTDENGAPVASTTDAALYTKDKHGRLIKTADLTNRDHVLGQKIDGYIPGVTTTGTAQTASISKEVKHVSAPQEIAQINTPDNTALSADHIKSQIDIPQTNVSVSEKTLNIPSKTIDDTIIEKASSETIAKTTAVVGGGVAAAAATTILSKAGDISDTITPSKVIKTVNTESKIPTDKAGTGFFSRYFRRNEQPLKTATVKESTVKLSSSEVEKHGITTTSDSVVPAAVVAKKASDASKMVIASTTNTTKKLESKIPTDPEGSGFFSRLFGGKAKIIKTSKTKGNAVKLSASGAEKDLAKLGKPAVKLPVSKGSKKQATITAPNTKDANIVVPAVVAGTAAAAAAIAKSGDAIKTISKMPSEIITITDPKAVVTKTVQKAVTKASLPQGKVEIAAAVAPKVVAPAVVTPKIAATQAVKKVVTKVTSPLDPDLTKLSKKDLAEATRVLKAMDLKGD